MHVSRFPTHKQIGNVSLCSFEFLLVRGKCAGAAKECPTVPQRGNF